MHRLLAAVLSALVLIVGAGQAPAQVEVPKPADGQALATFAGGCFWCVEADFDKIDGVIATTSGFMGGRTPNPTYKEVTFGDTGHLEVVQIIYDPKRVTYERLLTVFWRSIDPYDAGGQFCDRGESYTTAIFAHGDEQKRLAEASLAELAKNGPLKKPIATTVRDAGPFTPAEAYHQDFYKKNPAHYARYRAGCGRDARLDAVWGKKATN
jgi:peptide-methionine (S)-S-oxide reductase